MAQRLVRGLSGGKGSLFEFQTMLFQLLQARADLFLLRSAEGTRGIRELIGTLHDQHQIVDQALERGFFGNQVFIIKLHMCLASGGHHPASTCTAKLSFLDKT